MAQQYAHKPAKAVVQRKQQKTSQVVDEEVQQSLSEDLQAAIRSVADTQTITEQVLEADRAFDANLLRKAGIFQTQHSRSRQRALVAEMCDAAESLGQSFELLLEHPRIWQQLGSQEIDRLDLRQKALLFEAAAQDLPTLLEGVGYRGKPTPDEWVARIQQPLRLLTLGTTSDQAADLAVQAETELRLLTWRLRRTVKIARHVLSDQDPADDKIVIPEVRRRVRDLLRAGRNEVAPVVVAALVSGALFAAGSGPEAMAPLAGAAATDGLNKVIGLGACAAITQRPTPPSTTPSATADNDLAALTAALRTMRERQTPHAILVARRLLFQLVQDAADLPNDDDHEMVWEWAMDLDGRLDRADLDDSLEDLLHPAAQVLSAWRENP